MLKCTSAYPAPIEDANLFILDVKQRFGVKAGLSDHTLGSTVPMAAAALGAEKNVRSVKPGYSLHSKYLSDVLGKKFVKDVSKGERFSFELIDNRFKMLAASDRSSDFVLRQAGQASGS